MEISRKKLIDLRLYLLEIADDLAAILDEPEEYEPVDEVVQMLRHCAENPGSERSKGFIRGLGEFYKAQGYLSKKQFTSLKMTYNATAGGRHIPLPDTSDV